METKRNKPADASPDSQTGDNPDPPPEPPPAPQQPSAENLYAHVLYKGWFSQTPSAALLVDADTKQILEANQAACRLLAYTREELLQLTPRDIVGEEEYLTHWRQALQQGSLKTKCVCRRRNGDRFTAEVNLFPVSENGRNLSLCIIDDITRRQQRKKDLRLLSQAVEQSPAAIVITDTEGNIEYVNPQFTQITGYTPEEAIGQNPRLLKSGQTPSEIYQQLWQAITRGRIWRGQFCNRRKDGSLFWEEATIAPVFGEDGHITHYIAIKEDITRRKAARENLRQRNRQLAAVNQILQAVTATLDLKSILQMITDKIAELLDAPTASIWLVDPDSGKLVCRSASQNYRDILVGWELPPGQGISAQVVARQESRIVPDLQAEPLYVRDMEKTAGVTVRSALLTPLQTPSGITGVFMAGDTRPSRFRPEDLILLEAIAAAAANAIQQAHLHQTLQKQYARQKEMQAQLVHAEKLAAIGELVAGVAHELNNPLTAILLYAQLVEKRDDKQSVQDDLEKITGQARRASKIVRRLLEFARQSPPQNEPAQINDLLQHTVDLLEYELRVHNIAVETELDENLPVTLADPQQIQQVFINLILNALQAMDGDGTPETLRLGTTLAENDGQSVIRIMVQDSGPGIPPSLQSRIFDPFFTTKPQGQGTGLGLSVCHGIVSRHDGRIWAESRKGEGAVFHVELPVRPTDGRLPDKTAPADASQPEEAARILIIDDEESIVAVLTRLLRRRGYKAAGVTNGADALEKLSQIAYDLVICDLRMPDLSGGKVYELAVKQDPSLTDRFIFVTGDIAGVETGPLTGKRSDLYLQKPFDMDSLLQTVKRRLEKTKIRDGQQQ